MKYLIILLIACSCSVQRHYIEKAYIAAEVCTQYNGTYYYFVNITYTEGRQYFLLDTAKRCNPGDTLVIKEYKRGFFGKRQTLFINYKNQN